MTNIMDIKNIKVSKELKQQVEDIWNDRNDEITITVEMFRLFEGISEHIERIMDKEYESDNLNEMFVDAYVESVFNGNSDLESVYDACNQYGVEVIVNGKDIRR